MGFSGGEGVLALSPIKHCSIQFDLSVYGRLRSMWLMTKLVYLSRSRYINYSVTTTFKNPLPPPRSVGLSSSISATKLKSNLLDLFVLNLQNQTERYLCSEFVKTTSNIIPKLSKTFPKSN